MKKIDEIYEKFEIEELEKRLEMTQTFDIPSQGEASLMQEDGWEVSGENGSQPADDLWSEE